MLENTILSLVNSGIIKIHLLSKDNICDFNKLFFIFNKAILKNKKINSKNNNQAEFKLLLNNSELNKSIINYLKRHNKKIIIIMSDLPLITKKSI